MDNKNFFLKSKKQLQEEQRVKDVQFYGFKDTRRKKRKAKRLESDINDKFILICTDWTNRYIECGFDQDDKELLEIFERTNERWKTYCRIIIGRHSTDFFNTRPKRKRLFNKFEDFILSLIENKKD